ncbi:MAG: hypothetical protein FVQ85_10365 [Planctomycetes bacterium]|nr:hypothetical protein [Planctomycetota bacterium]
MILKISLFLIISLIGSAYLITFRDYTIRDLLVLILFFYPVYFLDRFGIALTFRFWGQWYLGFELFAAGLLVFFLLVKFLSPTSGKMRMFYPVLLLTSLVLVGLVSGIINGTSLSKYGAAVQAGFRWFVPFLVICVAISTLPKTPHSHALWAIALLTTTSILLYKGYDALGLACATLIAYFLHTVWQSVYLRGILSRTGNPPILREAQL